MSPPGRRVVLCADDFALTLGVSRAILDLAHRGRLSATSAMTTMPGWPTLAPALAEVADRLAVGLHLNLTTARPLGPMPRLAPGGALPSLGRLVIASLADRLPAAEIAAEIGRQLDAFGAAMGRPPDFVDGHQHVHVLRGVREPLIAALRSRGWRPWLRDPSDRLGATLHRPSAAKALVVRALASGVAREAARAGLATNRGFSGFTAFASDAAAVERGFAAAFARLGPAPVVMCHPGEADAELAGLDPVVASRPLEAAYLASEAFARLLAERGLVLARDPRER